MRRRVWSRNLKNEETMTRVGPQRHRKKLCKEEKKKCRWWWCWRFSLLFPGLRVQFRGRYLTDRSFHFQKAFWIIDLTRICNTTLTTQLCIAWELNSKESNLRITFYVSHTHCIYPDDGMWKVETRNSNKYTLDLHQSCRQLLRHY